jgi:hypothetical protein
MGTRERRLARADRLEGWADSREVKADAAHAQASSMADAIPFGQPVLVGHYSEGRDRRYRDRIHSTMGRAVEHGRKADTMRSRAANIRDAADRAIYSDDVDAVEQLEAKIAGLEAERDRIKRYNATARKGSPDLSILDDDQRADLVSLAGIGSAFMGKGGSFPAYKLSNLSGVISTSRKRLESLRNPAPARGRLMFAKYAGECTTCGGSIERGVEIVYTRGDGARHADCGGQS